MDTSGLVLDVYDDSRGEVLLSLFPDQAALPAQVKTAEALSPDDRDRLPDDAFALVLINGDQKLRKFACYDAGNTLLSAAYLLKTGSRLPPEAQKLAASNLCEAHRWYGLEPPDELEKIALGLGAAMTAFNAVPIAKGTASAIRGNLNTVRALEGPGHVVTPEQMREAKMAEASGTALMPLSAPVTGADTKPKAVIKKTAMGRLVQGHGGEHAVTIADDGGTPGKTPAALPQARAVHFVVTKEQTTEPCVAKKASTYALGERFPLDNLAQIKAALAYFDDHGQRFAPADRREFCSSLVKRAAPLNFPLSDDVRKYGSATFAPAAELSIARDLRRVLLANDSPERAVLDSLFEKRAEVDPELFCATLAEFDAATGLDLYYDRAVTDPYYSTFGFEKKAEQFSEIIGNEMVTEADLRRLARIGASAVKNTFNPEFLVEFQKDPVGIFKSLPRDQKLMVMRMANDTAPGIERTY
jgi:hypothetical protein